MTVEGTASVFVLRALAHALAGAPDAMAAVLDAVGVAPSVLASDERIPATIAFRAFDDAAARSGDPFFGLHAAERMPLGAIGFLDYHARSSPTIGEALRRIVRYLALVDDRMQARLEIDGAVARLVQRRRGERTERHLVEFEIAMIVARGRVFAGRPWPLRGVTFVHPRPADTSEHERFFATDVRFAAPADEIAFESAFLDEPLLTADAGLSSILERYGDALVAKLPPGDSFLDDARRAVAELLRGGDASLEAAATRLRVSRRTLQRRLQAAGTSHVDVVDDVRRELASRWLLDPRLSVTEVAYLLGFSEPAAFYRAFKRWTGRTPAAYRREHGRS